MKVNSPSNNSKTDGRVDSAGITTFKELKVTSDPTSPDSVANKAYVDKTAITDKYLPGDVMIRSVPTTPAGFLKCNGAEVTKTMYSALFTAIGETHNVYTIPGAGIPWRNQYGINSTLEFPLTFNWSTGSNLSAANMNFQVAITISRIYIFGRNNNSSTSSSTIYTATIGSDGIIGTWTTYNITLPAPVTRSQLFTYLGKLYIVGGNNTTNQTYAWRCTINTDGTISTFTVLTSLPFTVADHQVCSIQNKVYIIGGIVAGTASAAVYRTIIDTNGIFGAWSNATNNSSIVNLPYAISNHSVTVINRRLYMIGGLFNGTTPISNVYYNEFDDSDNMSAWTASTSFPETVYNASILVANDYLYVIGGVMNGVYTNKIYYAEIRADGSLGAWVTGGVLPNTISNTQVAVTNGRIYILGGYKGAGTALTATYYLSIPGGLNDYSPYFNGTITVTASDKFKLPDYTKSDNKLFYFIKY